MMDIDPDVQIAKVQGKIGVRGQETDRIEDHVFVNLEGGSGRILGFGGQAIEGLKRVCEVRIPEATAELLAHHDEAMQSFEPPTESA